MKVNIRCPVGAFGSLPYLASLMKEIFTSKFFIEEVVISNEYKEDYHNVLIDEGVSSVIYKRKADIWWSDSPGMMPNTYHNLQKILEETELFKKHYTVSEYNKEHYRKLGIPVEDVVIPRPVNPILFSYYTRYDNCVYDIITIGRHDMCDRKNLRLQRNIFLRLKFKYCVVSDVYIPPRPNLLQYNFGSITDELKAKLLSKSKFLLWTSFIEGFGMPVLEAMTVGTVPIYTDVPAHNEFAVGIPIKPSGRIRGFCYGVRVDKHVIEEKEIEEAVKYALGMKKEEWEDLSMKCMEKAAEMWNNFVSKVPLLLGDRYAYQMGFERVL